MISGWAVAARVRKVAALFKWLLVSDSVISFSRLEDCPNKEVDSNAQKILTQKHFIQRMAVVKFITERVAFNREQPCLKIAQFLHAASFFPS